MLKRDFFLRAGAAEAFLRRAWCISIFAITHEAPDAWKAEPYPYRLVYDATGVSFVDPDQQLTLTKLDDADAGEPLFQPQEKVKINAGEPGKREVPNITEDTETTYGRLLLNYVVIVWPFYAEMHADIKFPFINKRIAPKQLEEMILPRLRDDDDPVQKEWKGIGRNPQFIYMNEYLKFTDACFFVVALTQVCVPAATEKSMVQAPGMIELRNRLIEENKDRLHDPAVIAKIDAELVKFDKEYLKGDDSEGFLINDKSWAIVRKKLYGMHGAEVGLSESVDVKLIKNSLSEGWDISAFPEMNNSLRAGSFNRGAQTVLGGESVKWLLRASSNIVVTVDDCGSRLGTYFQVTEKNYKKLTGFHLIVNNNLQELKTDEEAGKYMGQRVMVRSPMFCNLDKTDYCKICVGPRLAINPTGLSSAVAEYGSAFLAIYMSAAHGKKLALAHMDYETALT